MEAQSSATQKAPVNVHFFANNPTESIENFAVLWHLVDINQPPQKTHDDIPWRGIAEGDLVVFPSILSGAGEFESVRFVGPKTMSATSTAQEEGEEEVLPLLTAGIEYPEFPTLIVSMAKERNVSIREMYELPFDAVLKSQPPHYLTLRDTFSQDHEMYDQFWREPPVARRRRPPGGEPWRISLGECVWVRTLDGDALGDSAKIMATEKSGGDEEL
ncbi:hypothetical protein HJC23_011895 [Cyclotella cryptica]|uniref:Uncharacterized protein n=1 Tax=Cyclotella cryptica TaxID=29204 RepID=A0ABD3PJP9_9STRA|eukprot:CCRYP_013849-RA/>CCRYP_013849-RA protein AED:0.26 eAED:0.26 QI:0/-1/0/1/-1/1/1/0/215